MPLAAPRCLLGGAAAFLRKVFPMIPLYDIAVRLFGGAPLFGDVVTELNINVIYLSVHDHIAIRFDHSVRGAFGRHCAHSVTADAYANLRKTYIIKINHNLNRTLFKSNRVSLEPSDGVGSYGHNPTIPANMSLTPRSRFQFVIWE